MYEDQEQWKVQNKTFKFSYMFSLKICLQISIKVLLKPCTEPGDDLYFELDTNVRPKVWITTL